MTDSRRVCSLLITALVFAGVLAGCDEPTAGPAKGGATLDSTGPLPPPPLVGPANGRTPPVAAKRPPMAPPASPTPTTAAGSTAPAAPAIRLSAGVALAQTGPNGTLMSFSVDYRFASGGPNATSSYVWVIERSQGGPSRLPVRLRQEGTLPAFVPGWRPEQGPFQSHIEDADGNRVSASISLR